MRRPVLVLVVSGLIGAALAVIGVLAAYWWTTRDLPDTTEFSFYSYSPPRAYVDYLPVGPSSTDWVRLLVPAGVAGAVVAVLLAAVGLRLVRRGQAQRP